jgi:hypothetical protein
MLGIAEGRDKAGDVLTANFLRDLAGMEYVEKKEERPKLYVVR